MARRDYKDFAAGEVHHVFNRGNNKMDIFLDAEDYSVFVNRLKEALYPTNVADHGAHGRHGRLRFQGQRVRKALPPASFELVAFCLMPNHFHLLILQKTDLPISALMLKVFTGYAKYFNKKHGRVGSLFQDQHKATHIEDNTQLLHTSAYIHNNPRTDGLIDIPESYPYSSFREYMNFHQTSSTLSAPTMVLEQFADAAAYRQFVYESFEVTMRNKE